MRSNSIPATAGEPPVDAPTPWQVLLIIPVFNDWSACRHVLRHVDEVLSSTQTRVSVLLVDDGSESGVEPFLPLAAIEHGFRNVQRVDVLRLRRNLGHQRAIAMGLVHAQQQDRWDAVVVMDGDGEDDPRYVPQLLTMCRQQGGEKIVFAARARRSESLGFRCGYQAYKLLHRLLVGRGVNVGNFSVIPRSCLRRLVAVPELWSHYAAAVAVSRIPACSVPTVRAKRVDGQSRMNFVALVVHGFSAILVFSELVAVRLLVATFLLMLLDVVGIGVIAGIRLMSNWAIPGWATFATGLLLIVLIQSIMFAITFTFLVLSQRSKALFLPERDGAHFVDGLTNVYGEHGDVPLHVYRLGA